MTTRKPTFIEILSDMSLNAGEVYDHLLKYGYVDRCPTTITSSSIAAFRAYFWGSNEQYEYLKTAAQNYSSPFGCGMLRAIWIATSCKRLTEMRSAQESDNSQALKLNTNFKGNV